MNELNSNSHRLSEKTITYVLPAVFSATVVLAFLYAYTEEILSVWGILVVLLTSLYFFIFDRISGVKKGAAVIFAGVLFAVSVVFFMLVYASGNFGMGFMLWFFSGNVIEPTRPIYLAAFIPAFSFFVSSTVYYFAVRIYRKHWLLIIGLLPFTAYVKMVLTPPPVFIILIAAEELIIYLQNTRNAMAGQKAGKKSVFIVYADFALALILAAAIFPKPNVAPYYEQFERALGRFSLNYNDSDRSGRLSLRSGNADNLNRSETRLLYTAALPVFDYLKLQSYPYYDGDGDFWYISNEAADFGLNTLTSEVLSFDELGAAVNEAAQNDDTLLSRYGLTAVAGETSADSPGLTANLTEEIDPIYQGIITAQGYSSVFAPAPSRTGVNIKTDGNDRFYALFGGGILTDRFLPQNAALSIGYAAPFAGELGYYDMLQNLSYDDFKQFLLDVMSDLPSDSEYREVLQKFFTTHTEAMNWRDFNTYQSPDLATLSADITAGQTTLSGKAQAIENFFNKGDFTYLLGYDAPDDSPEYFVFEGKVGSCSDFATAFTLLAGYAGLSVRYTEGYIPRGVDDVLYAGGADSQNDNFDYYEITSDDAHAYPEVYINGLWRRFEPTVSALYPRERGDIAGGVGGVDDALAVAYAMAAAIMGVLAVIIILLRPVFAEGYFRVKLFLTEKQKGRKAALSLIFARICDICEKRRGFLTASKTPEEIADYCRIYTGADIEAITALLEKSFYGGVHINNAEYRAAYECYRENLPVIYRRSSSTKRRKTLDIAMQM
ncbi:MAG: hypothetical protein LBM59_00380 [Ruminococcus sp.]|jgi:transglutaminase-like putative cysteine protease|nr:hypothetical protein [Ruminococcus sp.]